MVNWWLCFEMKLTESFLQFSHLAWVQTDRKSGGLGDLQYPLVSDVTKSISKSYGVLIPDQVWEYPNILVCWSHTYILPIGNTSSVLVIFYISILIIKSISPSITKQHLAFWWWKCTEWKELCLAMDHTDKTICMNLDLCHKAIVLLCANQHDELLWIINRKVIGIRGQLLVTFLKQDPMRYFLTVFASTKKF